MEQKTATAKQERRRFVLVFLIVGLVLANIILIYLILQNKNAAISDLERVMAEQKDSYEKELDEVRQRLEAQIEETKLIETNNQELLDSLQAQLEEVEADRDALKNTNNITQNQLQQYKLKIEGYEILLRKKDEQITELRKQADILYEEAKGLKNEKNELISQVTSVEKEKSKLQQKVDAAAVLQAENVNINAVDPRGRTKSGGQYRGDKIDKLDISFNLSKNEVAKIGNKDVYLRILEPAGTILYNQDGSSGDFNLASGDNAKYSARQQILFDNSRQLVRFQFNRSGEYDPGRYTVELYADGHRIGTGSFDVR